MVWRSTLGFKNQGVKDGPNLYVVKNTTMEAVMVELFFLDNITNQTLYTNLGYKKITQAIVNAIV